MTKSGRRKGFGKGSNGRKGLSKPRNVQRRLATSIRRMERSESVRKASYQSEEHPLGEKRETSEINDASEKPQKEKEYSILGRIRRKKRRWGLPSEKKSGGEKRGP